MNELDNFNIICRTCLVEKDELVCVFTYKDKDFEMSIVDVLQHYADIMVSHGDGLPSQLCLECIYALMHCAKFLRKCKSSDTLLKNIKSTMTLVDSLQENNENTNTEEITAKQFSPDKNLLNNSLDRNIIVINPSVTEECIDYEYLDNEAEIITAESDFENNLNDETYKEKLLNEQEHTVCSELKNANDNSIQSEDTSNCLIEEQTVDMQPEICFENGIESKETMADYLYSENDDCGIKYDHTEHNFDSTSMVVVSSGETINGHEVFRIYLPGSTVSNGQYFYVSDEQVPPNCKSRHYAYYQRISDSSQSTKVTVEEFESDKISAESYNCSFCDKIFSCKSRLVKHTRTHTGEKPYICAYCGKEFALLGGLDLHQRRHSGEKPYQCPHCEKGFAESSNLKVHIRSHTGEKPYTCNMCNRSFARLFLLQLHMRIHTGEKPYKCEYCDKAFRQQGDLASHRRIHSGDRPHKCYVCGKGFIKSSALHAHMRTHLQKPK